MKSDLHDRHNDHRRGERQQANENRNARFGKGTEGEQFHGARPNRRVRGELSELLERNVG